MIDKSGDLLLAVQEQNHQQKELVERVIEVTALLSKAGGLTSQSTINQSAGGLLGWVCVVLCVAMTAGTLIGVGVSSLWAVHEFERRDHQISDLYERDQAKQSYLNAIYAQAPQLQPKENKK